MPIAIPEKTRIPRSARIRFSDSFLRKIRTSANKNPQPVMPRAKAICAEVKGSIRTKIPILPKINIEEIYLPFAIFMPIL